MAITYPSRRGREERRVTEDAQEGSCSGGGVVLILVVCLSALAGGTAEQDVGSITLPVEAFVGRAYCIRDSDLPRYELACPVHPVRPEAGVSRPDQPLPPVGAVRYVLLLPGSVYRPVADPAQPDARGLAPLVRVKGALVYVPGPRGMGGGIVV